MAVVTMVRITKRQFPLISTLVLVLAALVTACDRGSVEERPGSGPTNREPATWATSPALHIWRSKVTG